MTGLLGYGGCYQALHEADLLLLLGTDFPYDDFLPHANNVQVDIDPSRLGRRAPLVQGIAADVGATMHGAAAAAGATQDRTFLDEMLRPPREGVEHGVDTYTTDVSSTAADPPGVPGAVLDEVAADDAVFTADTGMCCTWIARYITPNGRRRLIGSLVHGSMANALPMAIGAQLAYPGRQVVSMSGDGGLAMLLGELLTVKTHALPIKVIVFNNSSLGMVRLEMMVAGDPPFETDHDHVDYAAIAPRSASHPPCQSQATSSRRPRLFDHDGPALLDVVTTPDALEVPSHVPEETQRIRPGHRQDGPGRRSRRAPEHRPAQRPQHPRLTGRP